MVLPYNSQGLRMRRTGRIPIRKDRALCQAWRPNPSIGQPTIYTLANAFRCACPARLRLSFQQVTLCGQHFLRESQALRSPSAPPPTAFADSLTIFQFNCIPAPAIAATSAQPTSAVPKNVSLRECRSAQIHLPGKGPARGLPSSATIVCRAK